VSYNELEAQKNFTSSLISALSTLKTPPTRDVVEQKAKALASVIEYEGDLKSIIEEVMVAIDTRMGAGVSLIDKEAPHDEEWVRKREIVWTYSDAYAAFLKKESWHPTVVQSLSDVGERILGHLQDPLSEGDAWNRRGLVIGHVQSGKTANYLGVIAKAADAGYKFIIVIAGIHNNLRKQTQERVDEGFIGRSSDPEDRKTIGVGLDGDYPHPVTLTNINDDFSKRTAAEGGWKINDFSKPIIFVIKKNTKTLEALHKWLKELNAKGDGQIRDVPMLMIDDEADNASINTNKPDLDPTRTNAMLRRILKLFAKSCYVGYTATPFANIFINPDAYEEDVHEELFPRDFIYSLDAPTTYFGPDKVFLNDDSSDRILERITDAEEYLPLTHKREDPVADLPPGLYRAVDEFVVARAIRNLRGQTNKHCSMLINVSRFVPVQRTVRDFLSVYEKKLREAVKANYAMPEKSSSQNQYMKALRAVFDEEYAVDCGLSWDEVKAALFGAFEHLRLFVVNSKTDEALDFRKYEKDGIGLTAIAIGGLSLSRGLTIEGLTISYMYRNTAMYDTLMQMGRWFGYRPGYEDLCRVHLSPDSIDWYAHIANAADELRQQIKRMRRDGMSPKQFGLYVMAHPDSLLVTARNKMRAGKKIIVNQNFSGQLIESTWLSLDPETSTRNETLIAAAWKDGFGGVKAEETEKGWVFKNVAIAAVEDFLNRFEVHTRFSGRRSAAVEYLQALEKQYPHADVLFISKGETAADKDNHRLGAQERNKKPENGAWHAAKDRVASRGDEKHGLTDDQQKAATKLARDDDGKDPSDTHYRTIRNKPLLMLHVLSIPDEKAPEDAALRMRVPALGVSFPPGLYNTEIKVVANQIWLTSMQGPSDDPDDEEDYDE
jgi:hypothetical protein